MLLFHDSSPVSVCEMKASLSIRATLSSRILNGAPRYLRARICGFAKAFANSMETVTPLRTLFTSAGLKQAMHVPNLCRTLG
jgi:hypothetical protein